MTNKYLNDNHRGREEEKDNTFLYYLLKRGVVDLDQWDRPNDTSVRNLRYTAVVGDRLWGMIEGERLRVSCLVAWSFV